MAYRKFRKGTYNRYYKRKMSRRTGKYGRKGQSFAARVKRVLKSQAEGKYREGSFENVALYHDRGAVGAGLLTTNQGAIIWNPWYDITRGGGPGNRDADEIHPSGFAVRMLIRNATDRPNVHYRIVVAVIPKIYNGTVMDGTNFDLGSGASGNDIMTNFFKKEGVKVLYDKMIHGYTQSTFVSTGAGGGAATMASQAYNKFIKFYIRSKKGSKIKWMEDGRLANNPVGVWVIPYENYDTLRSDVVAHVSFSYKMYWRDI